MGGERGILYGGGDAGSSHHRRAMTASLMSNSPSEHKPSAKPEGLTQTLFPSYGKRVKPCFTTNLQRLVLQQQLYSIQISNQIKFANFYFFYSNFNMIFLYIGTCDLFHIFWGQLQLSEKPYHNHIFSLLDTLYQTTCHYGY